jgi:rhodanese-related sulfurtransferase
MRYFSAMSYKTADELIAEAKGRIREVTAAETIAAMESPNAPVLLDCREMNETNLGRIKGAIVIPRGKLEQNVEALVPRDANVVIYCASGNRSALAADTLQLMGYTNAASMAGGWKAWVTLGGPVEG